MDEVSYDEIVPSLCVPTERPEKANSNVVDGTDVNLCN